MSRIMKSNMNSDEFEELRKKLKLPAWWSDPTPDVLYISGGFVMARGSNGNPEVVYHMTPREFYCVSKGMEIV